jgi:hypothetical protein
VLQEGKTEQNNFRCGQRGRRDVGAPTESRKENGCNQEMIMRRYKHEYEVTVVY